VIVPTHDEVVASIVDVVHAQIDPKAVVTSDTDLLGHLALDSLTLLSLVVGLEDRWEVILSEEDAQGIRTVGELAALVRRKAGEAS